MELKPFDGELDAAPVSGLTPFSGKLDNEPGMLDTIKQGVGDIGLKLNVGTTVAIPEQVVGINDLARKTTPLGMLSEAITPEFVKKARGGVEDSTRKALNERRDDLSTEMSPAQQSADKKQYFADEAAWSNLAKDGITAVPGKVADLAAEGKLFGEGWGDWRKVTGSAAESLPGTVATMGPTFKIAGTAYEQAFAQTLAKTGSEAAAKAAATKAAERSAMLAGGAAEGLQGAGGANESTRRSVMEMPVAKLEQSPFFQEELKANGGDVEAARIKAADAAATMSAGIAFLFDATLGMLGDKYIGSAAAGKGTRAGAVARGTAQEMPTEFVQSGGEKFGENLGVREFADPSQLLMAGVGEEATAGGLAGGLTGGVMGGGLHRNRTQPEAAAAPPQLPDTGPLSRSANVALATQAAVPVAPDAPEQSAAAAESVASASPEQGPGLSGPDRVAEIDTESQRLAARLSELNDPAAGYGPAFDLERNELQSRATDLVGERDSITKSWPKRTAGGRTSFSTESGDRIEASYALMDASALNTSHDESLKPSKNYPAELQPRERDRAASEMQISGIAQRLDPARLGESADAATGAPIVGADGLVESGNARSIALKRVYRDNPQTAEDYRQFLRDNAARFGLDPADIDSMPRPVLVRVRETPVDRAEFARQANASTVAQMSSSEQARADAARIDVMDDLRPDDNGDFVTSRDFIRRFVARLPGTERAGMIDAGGQLSQSGYARVRNAVLAKAYGDSPVLTRLVESLDDNLRNVGKALMMTAPAVAKLRQDVAEGALHDADITADLLAAVEELSRLKDAGRSVREELAQSGMFDSGVSAEARDLLQFLDENIRKPRKIAEFIQRYAEALRAAGNPNQGSLLGEAQAPSKRDIINAAWERANEAAGQAGKPQGDQGAGQKDGGQREGTPGDRGGAQGDEAAAGQEWVIFPPETGTLGIPRAEMPQVKGEHRGALISFLKGQGIDYKTHDVQADELKPTQAEFSIKKAERWGEVREGADRSVLVSSDGYILDGHHQWVAALAAGDSVQAIQFDAPINELLFHVHQFPSVQRSDGAIADDRREQAREDFKEALADLGSILRDFAPIARMVPEKTPDLMPTLVRLFKAGLVEVGYNLKDLISYVKKLAKGEPATKAIWNKISDDIYRKAARQAIDQALSGDSSVRSIDDLSESSQFQIAMAMTSDDERAIQLAGLRAEIEKLQRLYRAHEEQRMRMRQDYDIAGETIRLNERKLPEARKAADRIADLSSDNFKAKADGKSFDVRKEFGEALLARFKSFTDKLGETPVKIGEISGFDIMAMGKTGEGRGYQAGVFLSLPEPVVLTEAVTADPVGVALKATNALAGLSRQPAQMQQRIEEANAKRNALEARITAPFPMAEMLADKIKEAQDLESAMLADQNKLTGIEREQQLEDLWQQKTGAITPLFSRGNGSGMAIRDLSAVVDRVGQRLKNLPKVHVLESPAMLSTKDPVQKALRDFIRKAGAWDDAEGATHEGEIYLFASGLADEARAEHVLAVHEVTHYGLRGAVGKGLDAALQEVWVTNAKVRKAAAALRERNGLQSNIEATEEVLADMTPEELAKLGGWRRVVKVVRDWLARAGFERLAAQFDAWMKSGLNEQELADLLVADLVNAARDWVKNGKGRPYMEGTRLADGSLSDDLAEQEAWLTREAKARGYKSIDEMAEKNYKAFENLAKLWREKHPVDGALLSRRSSQTANQSTAAQRADEIISKPAGAWRPIDTILRTLTTTVRLDRLTSAVYDRAAQLIDRYTPEQVKAGIVSDYGIPEAVIDQRTMMQGRMRVQLRKTGDLVEKLATLTRAESRVAYEWMNNADPQAAAYFEAQLPPESVKVMEEVKVMIDKLSQEAVDLGQLDQEAFKRNRFEYLRRSYIKHTAELTKAETAGRKRAIAILGDQYKGRGMSEAIDMAKFKNLAPEWWGRKLKEGQADKALKGEKFIRLERRAPIGEGVLDLAPAAGPGETNPQKKGRLMEVAYWPAGETLPAKYSTWEQSGTWEVRDTKGGKLVVWRDFTKQERTALGEIDEARYAIAKSLHDMIHDVETGRYLEWLGRTYGKKAGDAIDGELVDASERMRDVFKPGEWVQVPDTKIPGTNVLKYGKLAGRIIPGPVWNDVRQTVGFRFKPLGETYAAILGAWKTAKTALSPAVHTNNVMANFVMADWHDVSASHILKALRIILGASQRDGKGLIGRTGNALSRSGIADAEAAREILTRYADSGANLGSWVTSELQREQIEPLLAALEKELGIAGQSISGQIGVMVALQKALQLRFPSAWEAFKPTIAGKVITTEAKSLIDLYEAEDQVFRLAAWLKAKEDGAGDLVAGKVARRSFLDYNINAPWIQAVRNTALPFISFTYRAVPMILETAARKPHKLMKLGLVAGALNALGYMLSGGDEDDERKLLPDEKAGSIFGMVPKLIRMPWNDKHGQPVFLDIRRFVPVGDIFDLGATHSAVPVLPFVVPGGPLALLSELVSNKSQFTGKAITQETDTATEKAAKVADHLYKAFAPNIIVLPGTHAFSGVVDAGSGRTDAFGREQSVAQAVATGFGVKVGAYPRDTLMLNAIRARDAKIMEIDRNISQIDREFQRKGIDIEEYVDKKQAQIAKKSKIMEDFQKKAAGK